MIYKCDICEREYPNKNKIYSLYGYKLCSKHMHQLIDYGRFLDNNPRTQNDLNDYRIEGNVVIFDLYSQDQYKNNEFIIDIDDLEKVKYHKWRFSYGHVCTGNCTKTNPIILLHRLIMGCNDPNYVVDHIDCNPLNNRKSNLRICKQSENILNKSYMSNNTTGFIGVYPETRKNRKGKFIAEIRYKDHKFYIGSYELLSEAVLARLIAEQILFGKYKNITNSKNEIDIILTIPYSRGLQISRYVNDKINRKLFNINLNK